MNRTLTALTMIAAPIALAVAAFAAGLSAMSPSWWSAAVHLAVLGGITLMIYAVNIRIVPVFSRRVWKSEWLLIAQVGTGFLGAWITFIGIGIRWEALTGLGQILALVGGVLFMVNIIMLFKQDPVFRHVPPALFRDQPVVDRIATKFTRLSGSYLVLGLATGVVLTWWQPGVGRWDLVWAHMLLIGFFLSMASGVCYHVLSRWTGSPWRSISLIRWHYLLVALGLPLMVAALATDRTALFLLAGPVQALALGLFLVNILPLAWHLAGPVRVGVVMASAFLAVGVTLGIVFAIDPAIGAKMRQAHAITNLFGWSGLLISGFGYYFVPHFAGSSLRWPKLASVQLAVLSIGVIFGALATTWRVLDDGPAMSILIAQSTVTIGLLLFAFQTAGVFSSPRTVTPTLIRPTLSRQA